MVGLSQAKKRKNYADYNDEAHNIDDSVHSAFLCCVHASSNTPPNRRFPSAVFPRNSERAGRELVFKFELVCEAKNEFRASTRECRGRDRLHRRVDCHVSSVYRIPVSASRRPPPVSRSTTLASSPSPAARRPIERAKRRVAEHSAQPAQTKLPARLGQRPAGPLAMSVFTGGPEVAGRGQSDAIDQRRRGR